jgi:hypothetical protein
MSNQDEDKEKLAVTRNTQVQIPNKQGHSSIQQETFLRKRPFLTKKKEVTIKIFLKTPQQIGKKIFVCWK